MNSKLPSAKAKRPAVPIRPKPARAGKPEIWLLRLYVAGQTPKSLAAFASLKHICETHLAGRYQIAVIDLSQRPDLAHSDQIIALPTLVRKLPAPIKRVIGDLSSLERVLIGMELQPIPASQSSNPTT